MVSLIRSLKQCSGRKMKAIVFAHLLVVTALVVGIAHRSTAMRYLGILSLSCKWYFDGEMKAEPVDSHDKIISKTTNNISTLVSTASRSPSFSRKVGVIDKDSYQRAPINLRLFPSMALNMQSALRRLRQSNASFGSSSQYNLFTLRQQIRDVIREDFVESVFLTRANTPLNSSFYYFKDEFNGRIRVLRPLWLRLPQISVYTGRQYNKCSVVGSSGILSGSRCGQTIDESDFVFRMNNAPTSGKFGLDVGTKTNHMLLTGKSVIKLRYPLLNASCEPTATRLTNDVAINPARELPKIFAIRLPTNPRTQFMERLSEGCRLMPTNDGSGYLVFGNPKFNSKIREFWYKQGLQRKLSSGLHTVTLALHVCKRIDVYGFWPFANTPEGKSVTYHYYDLLTHNKVIHEFDKEFELLLKLHENGIINLRTDKC